MTTSSTSRRFTSNVSSPGSVACSPSAIVRGTSMRTRSPAASERRVSSPASGSTPTTRISGPQRLRGGRAAGDQPAAAHRHEQQVELRRVREQLERDRSLARHDERVVVRPHEREPALLGQRARRSPRGSPSSGRTARPRRRSRASRRAWRAGASSGMTIVAREPSSAAAMRDGLRVVAGGVGDDAASQRVLVEGRDLVVRAAELEGAAALEALRLDVDARADPLVERARGERPGCGGRRRRVAAPRARRPPARSSTRRCAVAEESESPQPPA